MAQVRLKYGLFVLLCLLLLAGALLGLWGWHREAPHWPEIWRLLRGLPLDDTDRYILLQLRLPRLVLAACVGMCLSAAGLTLQNLLRNPLVDPFVIGVSGGGALGAGVALLFNLSLGTWLNPVPIFAFLGALAVMYCVYRLGQYKGQIYIDRLLLAGVAFSALCSALLSLILVLKGQGMEAVVYWIMGSFSGRTWQEVLLLLPFMTIGLVGLSFDLKALNALQIGEESAAYLGVDIQKVKIRILVLTTLLSAVVVSVSGVIGFVGLMVPHMVRFLWPVADIRQLYIPACLLGALLLMSADALARNLLEFQEIPVGIFTALLGVPFFLWLLLKQD